jgi:hypothetical protein
MGIREGKKASDKTVDPGATTTAGNGEFAGQTHRQEGSYGPCSHRCNIAQAAGEGAVTDGLGRVPIQSKMASGDGKVRGYCQLFAGFQA